MSTLHLYVFIKHWVQERAKNPNIKLPAEYKRIETILGERFFPNEVHIPVMKLIDRYYGSDLMERLENDDYLKTSFERIFLTNYVYRGNSLAFFEKFYSRYKFLPLKINELNGENTHPLSKYSPLFHPLIKILE